MMNILRFRKNLMRKRQLKRILELRVKQAVEKFKLNDK